MRVAVGIHGTNLAKVIESYHLVSGIYTACSISLIQLYTDFRAILYPRLTHPFQRWYTQPSNVIVLFSEYEG